MKVRLLRKVLNNNPIQFQQEKKQNEKEKSSKEKVHGHKKEVSVWKLCQMVMILPFTDQITAKCSQIFFQVI